MKRSGICAASVCFVLFLGACGGSKGVGSAGEPAPRLPHDSPTKLNILVIGGTSGIGLETVKLALDRGHRVTAMSRNPDRVSLSHPRLTLVKGDIVDAPSVARATSGQDAVIIGVGIAPTREEVTVFSSGTHNVLAGMRQNGVERVILVSGIGAGDSRGHGGFFYDKLLQPILLKTVYQDKDRAEGLLTTSDALWTIVRPGFLTDSPASANYRVVEHIRDTTSGSISRADVAHFMVASLEGGDYIGSTVLISN